MNIEAVQKFCLSFPGVIEKESGEPSNVLAYYVGDKFFAYFKTSEQSAGDLALELPQNAFWN
jgi:hypothetical protein